MAAEYLFGPLLAMTPGAKVPAVGATATLWSEDRARTLTAYTPDGVPTRLTSDAFGYASAGWRADEPRVWVEFPGQDPILVQASNVPVTQEELQGIADRTAAETAAALSGTFVALSEYEQKATDAAVAALGEDPTIRAAAETAVADAMLVVSANAYGADPAASWEVNRGAFQAANDAVRAAGGGRVVAKPGRYTVKGVLQDSHVEFYLPGVTLVHPDGLAPDVIRAREYETTGTTAGTTLTVADATGIEVGSVVTVQAAKMHPTQQTTLTGAVTAAQTTGIVLADKADYPSAGWLLSGTEVIRHTGITAGGELTGVTRGAFGTTPAAHAAGDRIGMAARHYALATAVNGTTVTLDTAPAHNVTGAAVTTGALRPRIVGVTIIGNRVQGGAPAECFAIRWDQVRYGSVAHVTITNAEGGLMLRSGASDNVVDDLTTIDCGAPEAKKGSSVWMFAGCKRNLLTNLTILGDIWTAVYADDRTTTADEFDAANEDNTVSSFAVQANKYQYNPALVVAGSNRNRFLGGVIDGAWTGLSVTTDQAHLPGGEQPTCTGNEFGSIAFVNLGTPWILNTPGNILHDCIIRANAGSPSNNGGSLVYASSPATDQPPSFEVPFPDGTVSLPGIRFASDPNSGFMRQAEDQISLVLGATLPVRFFKTETRFGEGVHLAFGTATGSRIGFTNAQKLAFWGATPTTQPAAVADATDATTAVTQLNALLARLRAAGIIASA